MTVRTTLTLLWEANVSHFANTEKKKFKRLSSQILGHIFFFFNHSFYYFMLTFPMMAKNITPKKAFPVGKQPGLILPSILATDVPNILVCSSSGEVCLGKFD